MKRKQQEPTPRRAAIMDAMHLRPVKQGVPELVAELEWLGFDVMSRYGPLTAAPITELAVVVLPDETPSRSASVLEPDTPKEQT